MRFIDRIFKGRKPRRLDKLAGALLNLSFTANAPLDQRITFGRTTNATVTDSQGLVKYAPHNLLTHSEQFDNAAWVKNSATVTTNTITAPNGTTTAETFTASSSLSSGAYSIQLSNFETASYTISLFVKANTSNVVWLYARNAALFGYAYFDLSDQSTQVVAGSLSSPTGLTITAVGNDWYRISATFSVTASVSSGSGFGISNTKGSLNVTAGASIFVWGAQLEQGTTATTYNPTTVKNLLGYTEQFDNAAWAKGNSFVQTNLLTYSQDFDNAAWITVGSSAGTRPAKGTTTGTRPDGTIGVINTVVFPVVGSSQYGFLYQNTSSSFLNVVTTGSIYVRVTSGTATIFLNIEDSLAAPSSGNFVASAAQTVTTEWTRISLTGTRTTVFGNTSLILGFDTRASASQTNAAPITVEIWGAQLVQGTSAGDYKATYASAAAVGYPDIYGQPFAQKLVENTANTLHYAISASPVPVISGTPYTMSVYAKAAERSWALVEMNGAAFSCVVWFDLVNGVVGASSGAPSSTSITNVGNGWYRLSVTKTAIASTNTALIVYPATANSVAVYQGDGTSGIYIFGAQLSDSASADPYVYQPVAAPASTAYYGPRFDYDASTAVYTDVLGPELVTNGDGTTLTGWSTPTGGWAIDSGRFYHALNATYRELSQPVTIAKPVLIEFDAEVITANNTCQFFYINTAGVVKTYNFVTGAQKFSRIFLDGVQKIGFARVPGLSGEFYLDNISVKEYIQTTSTGATPKGLLIEEQRTNALTYSNGFSTSPWGATASSVTLNAALSPDGTQNAVSLVESATNTQHYVYQPQVVTAQPYTLSAHFKANTRTQAYLDFTGGSNRAVFNLATGVVVSTIGAGLTASITNVGNGWYRCSITQTQAATTIYPTLGTALVGAISYAGDGTSGIYIWGAQLEAGAFATSYIPTVASQVTRAADTASMIGNNFARWYNVNEGTLFADWGPCRGVGSASVGSAIAVLSGVPGANDIGIDTFWGATRSFIVTNSSTQGILSNTSVNGFNGGKAAAGYKTNDYAFSVNGQTPLTDTIVIVPIVTQLLIGMYGFNPGTLNGTIKRIAYYPRRLANTELQGITS